MYRLCSLGVAIALCWSAATASANGRFPKTVNVHIQPGNDQVILLAATFGLLISRDGGGTFRWVCEDAIGYGGTFDPDYALTADGTIFATTYDGLRISRDNGCTWDEIGGNLQGHWVGEVEVGPNGEVWAATSSGGMPNDVFLSTDNGQTFESKNMVHETGWWKSLRVAPSDSQRVYLTGYMVAAVLPDGGMRDPEAQMYRSDDGGDTWIPLSLADVSFSAQPQFLLEAVAPDNPDVVFARAVAANPPQGDALYRSTDAGATWTMIHDSEVPLTAFLIRENGDLITGAIIDTEGVHRSTDGGDSFTKISSLPQMCCLAENSQQELLACGSNWEPDNFALGRSTDSLSWEQMLRFSQIAGPLSCPQETVQYMTCESKRWPFLCEQFGCNRPDAGPEPAIDAGNGNGNGKGCCDTTGGNRNHALLWTGLVTLVLLESRRRRSVSR